MSSENPIKVKARGNLDLSRLEESAKRSKLSANWRPAYLLASAAYIIFVAHQPVQILQNLIHDDAMFWSHGFQILSGNWLGNYSQMTLPKGVGFPFVIAIGGALSLPVQVFSALILIGSLSLLVRSLRLLRVPEFVLLGIFLLTLSQSALIMIRPVRDNLYASLTLICVVVLLEMLRKQDSKSYVRMFAFGLGVGLFTVTREEGLWVIPGMLLLLVGVALLMRKNGSELKLGIKLVLSAVAGLIFVQILVMTVNFGFYGTATTQDFTVGSFPRALAAVQSVSESPAVKFNSVSLADMDAIYAVSPAFKELEPYFKGPGMFWTRFGCDFGPSTCGEFSSWFMWALRDAAASTGNYKSPATADAFFGRLADEVEFACDSQTLKCSDGGLWILPNLTPEISAEIIPTIQQAIGVVSHDGIKAEGFGYSVGDAQAVYLIRALLGSPQIMPLGNDDYGSVQGWLMGPGEQPKELAVRCGSGEDDPIVQWVESPDLVEEFSDSSVGKNRFILKYPSQSGCLLLVDDGSELQSVSLDEVTAGDRLARGDFQLYFEQSRQSLVTKPFVVSLALKNWLTDLNKLINPFLFWGGLSSLVLVLLSLLLRRSSNIGFLIIVLSLFAFILSRLALITYVSLTAFPALNSQYAMPIFALLPLAGLLSLWLAARELQIWAAKFSSWKADK